MSPEWTQLAFLAIMAAFLKGMPLDFIHFSQQLTPFLSDPPRDVLSAPSSLLLFLFKALFSMIAPLAAVLSVGMIGATLVQTQLSLRWEALKWKAERLSPLFHFKRLFSVKHLTGFLKNLLKILLLGVLSFFIVNKDLSSFLLKIEWSLVSLMHNAAHMIGNIFQSLAIGFIGLSILDYLYQRFDFLKNLRMTKEEIKKEYKQMEGDPTLKQRQRSLAQQRLKSLSLTDVPQATVVVTNPTHYSVALKYNPLILPAPIVVAKGTDLVAQKIQEMARAHHVPVLQNPPLARALYADVPLGKEIPPAHYQAVAELIRWIVSLKKPPSSFL